MFDLDDFIMSMNDVVLTAEENDIGMWELVDIAANYIDEKLGGKVMKKVYSLEEHKEFEKAAESIMFKALDNEKEVPIIISVGDVSVELPMCADYWNEMCFAFKECCEVENGELAQTTGNTKITSANLIRKYLVDEIQREADGDGEFMRVYQRLVRACDDDYVLNDISECIRIENDLRGSEVKCLQEDFENDNITGTNKLFDIVEKEIKGYLMSKFEVCYSESSDRSFLMFFGRWDHGQVVDFVWGEEDDWESDKKEVVDEFFEEIVANCNK